jgi:serine protease
MHTRRRSLRTPLLATAIAVAFAAPFAHTDTAIATASNKRPTVQADTDRFIVKFRDGSAEHGNAAQRQQRLDAIGREHGVRIAQLRRLGLGADVIKTDHSLTADQAKALVGRLRADPHVEYAEVDGRMYADFQPNDSQYVSQWHYHDPIGGIGMQNAWNFATGTGQVVAVVDTGITAHSDLDANILPGYDMITDTTVSVDGDGRDADPSDPGDWYTAGQCGTAPARNSSWHGTHVAGTIAAVTNNAAGVAGVAYNAKVVPVRVLGKCGGFVSDIADGILWASGATVGTAPVNANPAKVINLSLGGSGACGTTYQNAINTAMANGSLVVVSAGNSNLSAANFRPANCTGVVTVAASGKTGARSSFSNFGPAIEITAPGGDGADGVLSTLNTGTTTPGAEGYAYYYGTSMAAPHVSGVAALAREASGNSLTPAEISALLQATARTMPFPCGQGCGAGLLDANAAAAAATTPILIVTDPWSADEGNSGTATKTFTVKISKALASDLTFDYDTMDGTATAGSDYVAASGSGVIPAGSTSATVNVTVNGDTDVEADESFSLWVHNVPALVTMIRDLGSYTMFNDETVPLTNAVAVSTADPTINHNRYFSLAVPAGASNLKFTTSGGDGDADLYVRYNAVPTESTYDCRPYLTGNNETCNMVVQAGTWNVLLDAYVPYNGLKLTGSYELPVDVSVGDASVSEGDSGTKTVSFTVTLSHTNGAAVTYDIGTAGDTATSDVDFVASSATGESIAPGQLTKTYSVTINGDTAIEQDEQFFVNLGNASTGAGATITDGQGVGTITNDDVPSLSIDDRSSNEGNSGTTQQTFTVSLSEPAVTDVTFDIATNSGSATSGSDFAANSATGVTIAAGNTTATFSVDVNGDTAIEADETYTVDVTNVVGASVADGSGTGTITNDDLPTLAIADATAVIEGNAGTRTMTFVVNLSQAAPFPVSYNITTANGTATAGSDFVANSIVGATIPAGQTAKTFDVTINGDGAMERSETVFANISNASGATIADPHGVGTITNDDGTISIGDVQVFEGNSGTKQMGFKVTLSQASTAPVTFNAKTQKPGTTATDGVDFVATKATNQVIPAGQTSKLFNVTINGDTTVEPNEIVRATVSSTGVDVSDALADGLIVNDDGPLLSIADAGYLEGDSGDKTLNFIVTLGQVSATATTFNIFTVNGTAAAGEDYDARTVNGATIPAGQTQYVFSVTTHGDTKIEGNETMFVRISNANVGVLDGQARGVLTNDDGPVLAISDAQVTEGDSGVKQMVFTVSLSKLATAKVTFNFSTAAVTATGGSDFDPVSVTGLVIPYGQLSRTVSVPIRGDTNVEPDETLRGNISLSNVSIMDGVGIGTILNDDASPP